MPEAIPISARSEPALPVADYLREIDALLATHDCVAQDRIVPAIGAGRASRDVVRRVALEHYCLAKWTMPELPVLIANAPDVYRFTMEDSTHYHHWARRFADQAGYLGDPNRVRMAVDWCRQLGVGDDEVRAYTPLPQTIAMVCTMLFYVRRSYEEGIAVFAYAAERVGAGRGHARRLFDALRSHHGVTGPDGDVSGDAQVEAPGLFAAIATTRPVQTRCREAVRNVVLTAECRVRAMNRWVE